jgi:hypothetical protein
MLVAVMASRGFYLLTENTTMWHIDRWYSYGTAKFQGEYVMKDRRQFYGCG